MRNSQRRVWPHSFLFFNRDRMQLVLRRPALCQHALHAVAARAYGDACGFAARQAMVARTSHIPAVLLSAVRGARD